MIDLPKIKFGRMPQFDSRSRNFPASALFGAAVKPRSYTWRCDVRLDQGDIGACTGFAAAAELAARPVVVQGIDNSFALGIYRRAQQLDEWPGVDYEGSSVLGAMKACKERGYYREYRWAFGVDDLAIAVSRHGPAVLGLNWYDGMMVPDGSGVIKPTGELLGGHAILCNGFNVSTQMFRLHNSWGPEWGKSGDCFISALYMRKLLSEDGEACIPVARTRAI